MRIFYLKISDNAIEKKGNRAWYHKRVLSNDTGKDKHMI